MGVGGQRKEAERSWPDLERVRENGRERKQEQDEEVWGEGDREMSRHTCRDSSGWICSPHRYEEMPAAL